MLIVKDLHKSFGSNHVLRGISLEVRKGEAIGIIGPNGSGKTTLFNIISGQTHSDAGEVFFNDRLITGLKPEDICHLGIGRTFQINRVFPQFTAVENVMLGFLFGTGRRMSKRAAAEKADDLLEFAGLWEHRESLGMDLTLTQQRRLELAMALATEPKMLLLDEVAAGLSPKAAELAITLVETLRSQGLTLLVVDHVLRPLMTLADRLVVIAGGKKITEGLPREVAQNEQVIEAYLGEKFIF